MRKFSPAMLAAGIVLAALGVSVQQVSAQAAKCRASRNACLTECAPPGTDLNTVRCQAKCQKPYEQCLAQTSVTGQRPLQASPAERPKRQSPSYDSGILENAGPAFGGQGPAATGSPATRAPTPPPGKIY